MNPGNCGTFEKDKGSVLKILSSKPVTALELSEELKITPGYASALIFHIERHERFDLESTGTGRDRRYSII